MATQSSLPAEAPPRVNRPELPRSVIVLGAEGIYGTGGYFVPRLPRTLRGLGELIGPLGPRPAVFVHESAHGALGITGNSPSEHAPPRDGLFTDVGSYRPGVRAPRHWSWVHWRRDDGPGGFDLHVPGWGLGHPFAGTRTASDLIGALSAWYTATGELSWRGWGAQTSDAMLRRRAAATAVPEPLRTGQVREAPLQWSRAPEADERNYRWLHGLDVNGQYLAVAGSLSLPAGDAELLDFPTFDKGVPGLWHVELPPWVDDRFPPPWGIDHGGTGEAWVTTPTMERIDQELGVEAMEAWVWPNHGRHLRRWQETLRDAREWLLQTGEWKGPAGAAVKHVYTQGPGRLGSVDRSAKPPEEDPVYQPYWHLAVVAEARCRLHRRVRALPVRPVAVYRDALYFLSSRESPFRLAEALGLPTGHRLGGFKALGTISGRTARDILDGAMTSPGGTADRLMKMVKANNGD